MAIGVGDEVKTPETLAGMMQSAAGCVQAAIEDGKRRICVEVPLPITGLLQVGHIQSKLFYPYPYLLGDRHI